MSTQIKLILQSVLITTQLNTALGKFTQQIETRSVTTSSQTFNGNAKKL
jgi:hypothetical protein